MDIPNSGAIFTLGKSHLAENTQSYFYIKNDPVKRLISGPHQSAVICESGRLFVWGENHYGQLGIGGHGSGNGNGNGNGKHNSNGNGSGSGNGDIVTKPTCVKALKTLGLKISDVAFGNNWAVILTYSNEVFYTGRNIFPKDTHVAQHFSQALVDDEDCELIRKPFRLEEFDDYLSKNEETDNFVAVQAGNEHFAVLTSTGRLIGCGSNAQQQLGEVEPDYDGHPLEIQLDAAVQQFTCGPESTLVLTASGNLFLTGRLNEFVFPRFTELQKNLSANEQIIFMHISKTSEIYIITNVGGIYRSFESLRNKSLVFQRFYDYDSEENGPIWKLQKGFSFYAVLTKANKFFTTFSESGHHLKTFREISKFKNLRLLDIAVGDQHVLVQGIPRSSTLSATVGPSGEHRFMSRSFVLQPPEINGNAERSSSGKSLTKQQMVEEPEEPEEQTRDAAEQESLLKDTAGKNKTAAAEINGNQLENETSQAAAEAKQVEQLNGKDSLAETSPAKDEDKQKDGKDLIKETSQAKQDDKQLNGHDLQIDTSEEKKDDRQLEVEDNELKNEVSQAKDDDKQLQNNYFKNDASRKVEESNQAEQAAAMTNHIDLESDEEQPKPSAPPESPANLLHINKSPTGSTHSRKSTRSIHFDVAAAAAMPLEKGEEKQLRPRTPYPESSNSSTPQTIKPIRNFSYEAAMAHEALEQTSPELVDSLETVDENLSEEKVQQAMQAIISTPTPPTEEDEQLAVEITTTKDSLDSNEVVNEIRFINNGIDVTSKVEQQMPDTSLESSMEELEAEVQQTLQEVEEHVDKVVAKQSQDLVKVGDNVGDKIEAKLLETRDSVQTAMRKAATGARDVVDAVGENAKRMAGGAMDAVGTAGENAKRLASGAMQTVENAGNSAVKAAENTKESMGKAMNSMSNKISSEMQDAKENISALFQIKAAKETTAGPPSTPRHEHDELNMEAKEGAPKTTTTVGSGEDDERTTASVNSTQASAGGNGNPFEPNGNLSNVNESNHPFEEDPLDAIVERGKKAMQEELRAMELRAHSTTRSIVQQEVEQSKGVMRNILDRLSCRNEKSIRIEDETPKPPLHASNNKVNSELSLHNGNTHGDQQSSRVCTIL